MTIFSDEIITKLAEKLRNWSKDKELTKLYQWPLDDQLKKLKKECGSELKWLENLISSEDNTFNKTLSLRKNIAGELEKRPLSDLMLPKWIIEDWGGITTGKDDESLKKCLEQANNKNYDFNRIASWSKHIAFKYPEEYAIYDARVIYSLNWLLFKAGSKRYFPAPSGRNSVMELLDYSILLFIDHYKIAGVEERLKEDIDARKNSPGRKSYVANNLRKKLFIEQKEAFSKYCNLLKETAKKLYPDDKTGLALTKVEMMLFSLADKDIALDVLGDFSKILSQGDDSNLQKPITE